MKLQWLSRRNNKTLLVFCNGWGMDAAPFSYLVSDCFDVVVVSNYTELDETASVLQFFDGYERRILLSWSMGVVYGQKIFSNSVQLFEKLIAVNGTLRPVDDVFGIPRDVFLATLKNIDEEALFRFYRRMFRPSSDFEIFKNYKPKRLLEDQKEELQAILENGACFDEEQSIYTDIIISDKDFIVPTRNQRRFWQKSKITSLAGGHFPFYQWRSWDVMLADLVGQRL